MLVINKQQSADRNSVLFINADREYKEGKNQNSLRPEDIEKITHVYRNKLILGIFTPEMLQQMENQRIAAIKDSIGKKISNAQKWR